MEEVQFQCWLAQYESLSIDQKSKLSEVVKNKESLNIYEILEGMLPERKCPHCKSVESVKRGKVDGLQRYQCKKCTKTYNALTGTSLSRLRKKHLWLAYSLELIEGLSLRSIIQRVPINKATSFLWRHRFLQAPSLFQPEVLEGISEADETYFRKSNKGERNLDRAARKRGEPAKKRGLSDEQVPVLIAMDRQGAILDNVFPSPSSKSLINNVLKGKFPKGAVLCIDGSKSLKAFASSEGVNYKSLNSSKKIRVLDGIFHIQNVNSYDSRLKGWILRFKGVATKYLHHYLGWFRMKERVKTKLTPYRCLIESVLGGRDTCLHT